MKLINYSKCIVGMLFLANFPIWVCAMDGKPVLHFSTRRTVTTGCQMDTIPPKVKSVDDLNKKPAEEIIKVVPRVRKQAVPVPVSIPIKPPIIIKPKIIKPVIKILH